MRVYAANKAGLLAEQKCTVSSPWTFKIIQHNSTQNKMDIQHQPTIQVHNTEGHAPASQSP